MGTHIFVSIVKVAVKKFLKIHSNTSAPYWIQRAQNLSFLIVQHRVMALPPAAQNTRSEK
jgi:hypothetical protein